MEKALALGMATALRSSLKYSAASAVNYSRPMWRHAYAGTPLCLLKRKQDIRLRCSSGCSDPETERWVAPLIPEEMVEPTGQGKEEWEAIWNSLVREPLRPIVLAMQEIVATRGKIFRCHSFHIGLLSGPLLVLAGFIQVYKVAPNLCVDIVLGYICYKLSILAAQLKRDGRVNSICTRIQLVLWLLLWNSNNSNEEFYGSITWLIRSLASYVFACAVIAECIGVKHPRRYLEPMYETLLFTKGGPIKVLKSLFLEIE